MFTNRRSLSRVRLRACALVAALAAAGCGGGGGGGGGSGVHLSLVGDPSVALSVPVGRSLPDLYLDVRLEGDLGALEGRTVYVAKSDPAGLYQAEPSVSYDGGAEATVVLAGKPLAAVGHYQGRIRLTAYLDAQHTEALGNAVELPYDVTVTPGILVVPESVDEHLTFGQGGRVVAVAATAPPGAQPLQLEFTPWGKEGDSDAQWRPTPTLTGGALQLAILGAPVGTYRYTYTLATNFPVQFGTVLYLTKDVVVRYTVDPDDAVDFQVTPAAVEGYGYVDGWTITNEGTTLVEVQPAVYLTAPASAEEGDRTGWVGTYGVGTGTPAGSQTWWSTGLTLSGDWNDGIHWRERPAGTYTATVRYVFDKGGTPLTYDQPVRMVISR